MDASDTKLPPVSRDVTAERLAQLRALCPEAFTEGKLDATKLKQTLGIELAEGPERFGLSWSGKSEAIKNIQTPTTATLLPARGESVNFDATENLIIEGDNLETLKLLQGGYHGRVKMIYIDPPYNTGGEFIYPDNYKEGLADYLKFSGQVSGEGIKLTTNAETDGRYHSKWLTMMYPRLFLARNLLREDGVIFVSIDDHEVHNLRAVMNEIYGEENFVAELVWEKSKKGDAKLIAINHEYVLIASKNKEALIKKGIWRRKKLQVDEVLSQYTQVKQSLGDQHDAISAAMRDWYSSLPKNDARRAHEHYRWSDKRGLYFAADFAGPDDGRESRPRYDIIHPVTQKPCKKPSTGWRWEEEKTKQALIADPPLIHFGPDETTIPCRKTYLAELNVEPFGSVFYRDGRAGTLELEKLVGKGLVEFPKDKETLSEFIELASDEDSIILDFFAGSGTTAQAVLELNAQDGGNRKFILVQLPEPTERKDFPTIAEITKERVRRVIKKLHDADDGKLPAETKPDRGFKVFKLSSSNFKVWDSATAPKDAAGLAEQLKLMADNVEEGCPADALLYELILRSNLPLTSRVVSDKIGEQTFYDVADGTLAICLERKITQATLRGMLARKPKGVICLDTAFAGNDQLKTNIVLEMKSHQIEFHTA